MNEWGKNCQQNLKQKKWGEFVCENKRNKYLEDWKRSLQAKSLQNVRETRIQDVQEKKVEL